MHIVEFSIIRSFQLSLVDYTLLSTLKVFELKKLKQSC